MRVKVGRSSISCPASSSIPTQPRKMVTSAMATSINLSLVTPRNKLSSFPLFFHRNISSRQGISALSSSYGDSSSIGFSSRPSRLPLKLDQSDIYSNQRNVVIEAKKGNPPIMPAVMTPGGPLDLSTVLFRNRIIFIGQPINSQVAQRVISQLVTLATIDDKSDILIYLNCPGGSTYSVLAIYDCMSWIKPNVGTVCFGVAASQGALLLAGGQRGMRYAMPNARIMIHQPQSGCGGRLSSYLTFLPAIVDNENLTNTVDLMMEVSLTICYTEGHVEDVRRQVNEAVQSRHKIDKMYTAFTGQTLEKVQQYTERDRFLSVSEAMEFGLIDGVLETEY